jgi:hypothetical protein
MSEAAIASAVTALISAMGAVIVATIHNRGQAASSNPSRPIILLPGGREVKIALASSSRG